MQRGMISIIVPTSGKGRFLWECLDRLGESAGDLGIREVLIVVNGPYSNFDENRYRAFISGLRADVSEKFVLVREPVPGLLAGRHRGAVEASGDYLSFVDDDVLLGPKWSSAVSELCNSGDLGNRIAGGPVKPDFRGAPPAWLSKLEFRGFDSAHIIQELSLVEKECLEPIEVSPFLIFGLNFTIGRATLFSLGGFHPDLTPPELLRFRGDGESAIAERLVALNLRAIFHPDLTVRHVIGTERLDMSYLCGVWFRQGVSNEFLAIRTHSPSQVSWPVASFGIMLHLMKKVGQIVNGRRLGQLGMKTGLLKQLCLAGGRLYLRFNYARDNRVREWIARRDYFDYSYPV